MTRFWLSLEQAVDLVLEAAEQMQGGEIFVPKIPSMRIVDLARAIAPTARIEEVGRRPGEKLHEILLTAEESQDAQDRGRHYVILPDKGCRPESRLGHGSLPDGFVFSSDANTEWMSVSDLRAHVAAMDAKDAKAGSDTFSESVLPEKNRSVATPNATA